MIRANVSLTKKQESTFRRMAIDNGFTLNGYIRYLMLQEVKRLQREEEQYATATTKD